MELLQQIPQRVKKVTVELCQAPVVRLCEIATMSHIFTISYSGQSYSNFLKVNGKPCVH